ncbi:hypothetical protein KCH_20520 [Kitasatospora cheerisanensis KCTC 2395]|uniref:Uncharacterized protein n=1 Tax=Kitasatospora cheerisanensis KCTC 2395 TaxID=1348663 RepID=A0A066Z7W2_9ACTN|nr:hypothetical protein KCH_20520 [Kitasatospora cheerisanensis KCTC 2395]
MRKRRCRGAGPVLPYGTGSGRGIRGRAGVRAAARCAFGGYGLIRPGLYRSRRLRR